MVEEGLRDRCIEDCSVFLTERELSELLHAFDLAVLIVELSPDFNAALYTGDHSELAVAAGLVEEGDLAETGSHLYRQGFRLLSAAVASAPPSFDDLKNIRPLILHAGIHYFILDDTEALH